MRHRWRWRWLVERHALRRIAFTQECASDDGDFVSLKVPDEDNPTDFMGKLVEAKKYLASIEYLMQLSAQVADGN